MEESAPVSEARTDWNPLLRGEFDHQPFRPASERFMRNHMDLNVLEASQRFPRR